MVDCLRTRYHLPALGQFRDACSRSRLSVFAPAFILHADPNPDLIRWAVELLQRL
jgi:hypothetical protein